MAQPSPGRFQALWTSAAVGVALVSHLARFSIDWTPQPTGGYGFRFYLHFYGIPLLTTILLGCLQAKILAVQRRRIPCWALATVLGWAGGILLGETASYQVIASGLSLQSMMTHWILGAVWAVTGALSQGVAQALALWGRRWGAETMQWLSGLTLAHLLAVAVWLLASRAPVSPPAALLLIGFASVLLSSAVAAAGTAWLLDRIVFRPAPAEAPTA